MPSTTKRTCKTNVGVWSTTVCTSTSGRAVGGRERVDVERQEIRSSLSATQPKVGRDRAEPAWPLYLSPAT